MNFKLSEKMTAVPPGVWFDASKAERFMGLAWDDVLQGGQTLTLLLQKSIHSNGASPVTFETKTFTEPGSSPVDHTLMGYVDGKGADLGVDGSGNQYRYVALTISGSHTSPAIQQGLLVVGDLRFTTDALNHGNAAPTS
jgi:hypothetical protein